MDQINTGANERGIRVDADQGQFQVSRRVFTDPEVLKIEHVAAAYPSHGVLPTSSRVCAVATVQWSPPRKPASSSQPTGTEIPSPGRARADQADTVVAPRPLRR